MADMSSFDIVSRVNLQEVKNAIDQTHKEIRQRFDLKDTQSSVTFEEEKEIKICSNDEYKLKAVMEILQSKLIKRGVSLKSLIYETIEKALGGTVRQRITLQQGIVTEKAKAISQSIRDLRLKAQTQIQGDQLRVSSKSKDELQEVMRHLREKDFDLPLEFVNYR